MKDTLGCRHFGTCGGCSLLDVPIGEQLARKRQAIGELLAPFLPDGVEIAIDLPPRTPRSACMTKFETTRPSFGCMRGP